MVQVGSHDFYVLLTLFASRVAVKRYGWIRVSLSNRSEHKGRGLELVGLSVFCRVEYFSSHARLQHLLMKKNA